MLVHGVAGANARGPGVGRLYTFLAFYLVVFWFGYPIVWGLAEGGNVISSTAEVFPRQPLFLPQGCPTVTALSYFSVLQWMWHGAPLMQAL
jgi:hypothetical protein